MLLNEVKGTLKNTCYNRINRIQEMLNQYGNSLQELEIELADLNEQLIQLDIVQNESNNSIIRLVNNIFYKKEVEKKKEEAKERRIEIDRRKKENESRTKVINDEIALRKSKIAKLEERISQIENVRSFEELKIKDIKSIKEMIEQSHIILDRRDQNIHLINPNKNMPYLVYGLDYISDNVPNQIFADEQLEIIQYRKIEISKKVEKFNVNSINGLEKSRYILLIPVDKIPKENIIGINGENQLEVKKFDKLEGAIVICSEKHFNDLEKSSLEKVVVKSGMPSEYVRPVLNILGEELEAKSVDIRTFENYKDISFEKNIDREDIWVDLRRVLIEMKSKKHIEPEDMNRRLKGVTKYDSITDIFNKAVGKNAKNLDDVIKMLNEELSLNISKDTKLLIKFAYGKFNDIDKLESQLEKRKEALNLFKKGKTTKKDLVIYSIIKDYESQEKEEQRRKLDLSKHSDNDGKRYRRAFVGSREYNENALNLFKEIMDKCRKNSDFMAGGDSFYSRTMSIYIDTVVNWKLMHNLYNYNINIEGEIYQIRPNHSKTRVISEYPDENDSIYNAAKLTYVVNKLAHAYQKQTEELIKRNFLVDDDQKIDELLRRIKLLYSIKDTDCDETYKKGVRDLRAVGDRLLETNRVEYLINSIAKREILQRSAYSCKNELIDYMVNRVSLLPKAEQENYVVGYKTNESGTCLVCDIPNYEQLIAHVVSNEQKNDLQEKLPEYPLDVIVKNRGNVLMRGLNKELEEKLKHVGEKTEVEKYVKTHVDEQQAHEVFLRLGYEGRDLIRVMNGNVLNIGR